MKKIAVAFIAALCGFGATRAHSEDWTRTDKLMLAGALGLIAVDWAQTRDLIREREHTTAVIVNGKPAGTFTTRQREFHERNPLLGENPTRKEVNAAALIAAAGTVGLSLALPQTPRRWFLGGVMVVESIVVLENHRLGLRVSF